MTHGYQPRHPPCIHLNAKHCNALGVKCIEKRFFGGIEEGQCLARRVAARPEPSPAPPKATVSCCGRACGGDE